MSDNNVLSKRLEFYQIDRSTRDTLHESSAITIAALPAALEQFYRHINSHPEASSFFRDRVHMDQAKNAQLRHWNAIAEGRLDENYMASVTRIGETHARLGLEPELYVGGYSFLICRIMEAVEAKLKGNRQARKRAQLQMALTKAALLDMELSISVYIGMERRQREAANERLLKASNEVADVASAVSASANELEATARSFSGTIDATTVESGKVAAASDDAAKNVQTVAAATEQLSASIREIADQVRKSVRIAEEAVGGARNSNEQVLQLQHAAGEIDSVVNIINAIAAQTNLLALNATIEAARAGESGRGFAVVAQEVKALAEQTTRATSDIGSQVKAIQSATGNTAGAIHVVVDMIEEISGIALALSSAIEEQGSATQEIACNTSTVSNLIADVSRSAGVVDSAARETSTGATEMLTVVGDLARNGEKLRETLLQMKVA